MTYNYEPKIQSPGKASNNNLQLLTQSKSIYISLFSSNRKSFSLDESLRIYFPFFSTDIGGAEISSRLLMLHLKSIGKTFFWSATEGSKSFNYLLPGLEDSFISSTYLHSLNLSCFNQALLFLIEHRISIVHTNDQAAHLFWAHMARLAGVNHFIHYRNKHLKQSWTNKRGINIYKASNAIFISQFCRNICVEHFRKSMVIYNPLLPPGSYSTKSPSFGSLSLCYAGRTVPYKRFLMLLHVAKTLLLNGLPRDTLKILYFGCSDESWGLIVNRSIHHGVGDLVGRRPWSDDIIAEIPQNSIMICPAVEEAFGRLVAECVLSGVPLVAGASGGHLETVPHQGIHLLADPDNPEDYAIQVLKILFFLKKQNSSIRIKSDYIEKLTVRHSPNSHCANVLAFYAESFR